MPTAIGVADREAPSRASIPSSRRLVAIATISSLNIKTNPPRISFFRAQTKTYDRVLTAGVTSAAGGEWRPGLLTAGVATFSAGG